MSRILDQDHLEKENLPKVVDYIENPKAMYDFAPSMM